MKKIITLLFFCSILLSISSYIYYKEMSFNKKTTSTYSFKVKKGSNLKQVSSQLKEQGIISSAILFNIHAYISNKANKIKSGQFLIKTGSSIDNILNLIISGKTQLTKVTIPEGKNLYEIAKILELKKILNAKEFIKNAKSIKTLPIYSHPIPNIEGLLFPETYYLSENMASKEVIQIMINEFKKKTSSINWSMSKLSPYEVLILASIVEKETGKASERKRIAGVFANRLKKGMKIQSDPTTIYGIFENFDGNIRRKDLRTPTPYNTYTLKRLPIGPISNPGLKAIEAVLSPEENSFLYFVSKNDGSHTFSRTYQEHKRKVYQFQINR